MGYKYEPISQYDKRQPVFDAMKQQLPEPVAWGLQGIEYLTRPLRAVVGGVSGAFPRPGGPQDPLTGISTGLAGGYAPLGVTPRPGAPEVVPGSFAGEAQQRFGEMGRLDLGPFTLTGAMVVGLPADIALDPLTHMAFGATKLPGIARRATPVASPMARSQVAFKEAMGGGPEAMGTFMTQQAPQTWAGEVAGAVPGLMQQATPPPGLLGRAAQAPVVGRFLEPLIKRVNNVQFQGPLGDLIRRRARGYELWDERMPGIIATVQAHPGRNAFRNRLKDFITPKGESLGKYNILLDNGNEVTVGRFMENPSLWQYVDDATREFVQYAHKARDDILDLMKQAGIDVELTTKLEGSAFFPRMTKADVSDLQRGIVPTKRGILRERVHDTMAQGILAGEKYIADPTEILDSYIRRAGRQIVDEEWREAIKKSGILVAKGERPKGVGGLVGGSLEGKFFTNEHADLIEASVKEVGGTIGKVRDISGIIRTLTATADFAAPLIQGIPFLVRNPIGFMKGWYQQFRYFKNPRLAAEHLAKPEVQDLLRRMPEMVLANPEYFEALPALKGVIERGGKGAKPAEVASGALRRFQAAFDGFGNYQRTSMGFALVDTAERLKMVDEVTDYINKASGIISTVGLGLSETQRAVESGIFFFAPRYTRASLMLVGDVVAGGMRGAQARKSLGAMMSSGILWYAKTTQALGQDPKLDPTKADFMTLELEGSRVGVGSIWVSMLRTLGRVVQYPERVTSLEPDNPIAQFFRSRAAPAGSIALDKLLYGETFIGEPLESGADWAQYLSSKFMPFALESLLFQQPEALEVEFGEEKIGPVAIPTGVTRRPEKLLQFGAELLGARTFPKNFQEMMDSEAKAKYGLEWDALSASEQSEIRFSEKIKNIPTPSGKRGDRMRIFDEVNGNTEEKLLEGIAKLDAGEWHTSHFRKYYNGIMAARSAVFEQLDNMYPSYRDKLAQERHKKSFAELTDQEQMWIEDKHGLKNLTDTERARRRYVGIFVGGSIINRMEDNPFEAADEYLASLPTKTQEYIREREFSDLKRYTPKVRTILHNWKSDRNKLEPYWNIRDEVMKMYGLKDRWDAMTLEEKRQAELSDPTYKMVKKEVTRRREAWRLQNATLDKLLVRWGYVSKLITERQ